MMTIPRTLLVEINQNEIKMVKPKLIWRRSRTSHVTFCVTLLGFLPQSNITDKPLTAGQTAWNCWLSIAYTDRPATLWLINKTRAQDTAQLELNANFRSTNSDLAAAICYYLVGSNRAPVPKSQRLPVCPPNNVRLVCGMSIRLGRIKTGRMMIKNPPTPRRCNNLEGRRKKKKSRGTKKKRKRKARKNEKAGRIMKS